jgi:hypothetical protein
VDSLEEDEGDEEEDEVALPELDSDDAVDSDVGEDVPPVVDDAGAAPSSPHPNATHTITKRSRVMRGW